MINTIDLIKQTTKNLLYRKNRIFLTIFGIIIGVFTFSFFIFASKGLETAITQQFTSFGVNVLAVRPLGYEFGPPSGAGLTDTDIEKIKQVASNYKYIAPALAETLQYNYKREKANAVTIAYKDKFWKQVQKDLNLKPYKGRMIKEGDSGVIYLGYKFAENAFGKEKFVNVGSSIKIGELSFRVIGIGQEKGDLFIDNSVLMPFNDLKKILNQDTYSIIRISFYEGTDMKFMEKIIDEKLNKKGKEKRVEITSPKQAMEQLNNIVGLLQKIISFVSLIALFVGGINVMNTMHSNVIERISEISVMKALGAENKDIQNLFLLESSFLGFLGGVIGFLLSFGFAKLLAVTIKTYSNYNIIINFDWYFFIIMVLLTTISATIFGTYPALKASKINPADNLKED